MRTACAWIEQARTSLNWECQSCAEGLEKPVQQHSRETASNQLKPNVVMVGRV
jgi:hypothetical protein